MPNFQKYTSVAFNNPQDTNKFAKPLVVNGDNRRAAEERICNHKGIIMAINNVNISAQAFGEIMSKALLEMNDAMQDQPKLVAEVAGHCSAYLAVLLASKLAELQGQDVDSYVSKMQDTVQDGFLHILDEEV